MPQMLISGFNMSEVVKNESFKSIFVKLLDKKAKALCPEYIEGEWLVITIAEDLFFMYPNNDIDMYMCSANNGYEAELSTKAFGFVCTIYALDNLIELLIKEEKYNKIKPYQDVFDNLKDLARENILNQDAELAFISRDMLRLVD